MKKRILSILTVTAMLLSMCAVSVYAEDAEITTPVTYNYTYEDGNGSKLEVQTNSKFGRPGNSYKVSYKENGNKNLKVGTADGTTNNVEEKPISSGQKIKVSLKAAGDSWNPDNVTLFLGIAAKVGTATSAANYSLKINNSTGEYMGWGNSLKKTTIGDDKFTKMPIPNKTWVQYDVVFSVYNDHNKLSVYANGRPLFEDVVLYGTVAGEVLKPFTAVTKPMMTWYAVEGYAFHLADVSMTIYPANYNETTEGKIVEDNPVDFELTDDFERETDGAILYKGMKILTNADNELVAEEDMENGWSAQYVSADDCILIKKGKTVYYYEKAFDRIEDFNINNMTVNPGKKECTVTVRNIENEAINPTLFLASYSGKNMVKIARSQNITIQPEEKGTLKVNLEVGENESVDKIRIFLFDSTGSLVPLKLARATAKSE